MALIVASRAEGGLVFTYSRLKALYFFAAGCIFNDFGIACIFYPVKTSPPSAREAAMSAMQHETFF